MTEREETFPEIAERLRLNWEDRAPLQAEPLMRLINCIQSCEDVNLSGIDRDLIVYALARALTPPEIVPAFDDLIETAKILQGMAEDFHARTENFVKWGMLPSLQATLASIAAAEDARAALHAMPLQDHAEWKPGTALPDVKRGREKEFIVAVRRAHSGKVYSFASTYLNAYPLEYLDGCPKDVCDGVGCDDGCPTTGWFIQTGEDGDGTQYHSLDLKEGDELLGWRDVPQWLDAPVIIAEDGTK